MRHMKAYGAALIVGLMMGTRAYAQQTLNGTAVAGVAVTTEGFLRARQVAAPATSASAADRRGTAPAAKGASFVYISLPGVLAQWKAAKEAGKEVPDDVRYMKGMTRIQNVFVYPAEHDVVLAGPAEAFTVDNPLEPLGRVSRRPVVQLEDLIVAMRAVQGRGTVRGGGGGGGPGGRDFFGCTLEQPANFKEVWDATMKKYGTGPRATLLEEMKKGLGPQEVKLFGVPDDSRVALMMVAADYRLKRMSMGLETLPAGVGNAFGTENAMARLWFEPAYEPLVISAEGDAYELRGPRLKVLAGAQVFNPVDAAPAQKRFAEHFSAKMAEVAAKVDAVADLQNVTDCFMVAALLRADRLLERTGVDVAWLIAPDAARGNPGAAEAGPYKVAALTVPRTAETVVHISGNVIAQGGVAFAYKTFTDVPRGQADGKVTFSARRDRPADQWFLTLAK